MQQSKVCHAQDVMSLDYSGSSSLPMAFTRASSAGECVGDKTLGTEVEHAMVRIVERPLAAMKALGCYSAGGNTSICSSLTKYRLLPCLLLLPRPRPWGLVPVCRRSARYKRSRLSLHTPRTRPGCDLVRLGAGDCWGGDSLKLSRHSRHSLVGHFQYLDAPKDELPRSGSSRVVIIPTTTRSLDGTKPRPSESVPRRPGSDEVPANHDQLPQLLFIYMQKRLGYGAGILDPDLYKGPVPRFPPSCWEEMKARKKDGPRERLLQPRIGHELRY